MFEVEKYSNNPVATINVYLGDTRLVSKLAILTDPDYLTESGNTFYYHADHLGSSSLITDSKAWEYERMAFTPHGEVWQQDSLDTLERIDLLFTGKSPDAETGWYYFGARYLDPKTGLWLSGDPALGEYIPRAPLTKEDKEANGKLPGMGGVFNPVNLALYHYAGNNPVKYLDPDGRQIAIPFSIPFDIPMPSPGIFGPPIIAIPNIDYNSGESGTPSTQSPEGVDWGDAPSGPGGLGPDWEKKPGTEKAKPEHQNQFRNKKTDNIIRWDEKDNHWHRINPKQTGNKDCYLDKYGNPVAKWDPAGHIQPKSLPQKILDFFFKFDKKESNPNPSNDMT